MTSCVKQKIAFDSTNDNHKEIDFFQNKDRLSSSKYGNSLRCKDYELFTHFHIHVCH